MTYYARIILEEDMEWTGEYGNALDGEITEYTDLRRIERPAYNTEGRMKERIRLTHSDGSTEEVVGYFVGSGQE